MQLVEAKQEAAARSLESKKKKFVDVDDQGDCLVKDHQSHLTQFVFENGQEVPFTAIEPSAQTEEALGNKPRGKAKKAKPAKAAKETAPAEAPAPKKAGKKVTPQKSNKVQPKTKTKMAKVAKKAAKKSAKKTSAPRTSMTKNPFKAGQKVSYDGRKYEIKRAYMYKGRAVCIITDNKQDTNRQVSAASLRP